jgi:hypothetical protein
MIDFGFSKAVDKKEVVVDDSHRIGVVIERNFAPQKSLLHESPPCGR